MRFPSFLFGFLNRHIKGAVPGWLPLSAVADAWRVHGIPCRKIFTHRFYCVALVSPPFGIAASASLPERPQSVDFGEKWLRCSRAGWVIPRLAFVSPSVCGRATALIVLDSGFKLCSSYISFWKVSFLINNIYLTYSTAFHIIQTVVFLRGPEVIVRCFVGSTHALRWIS